MQTSEPAGETQVKDGDVPVVRNLSETQLATNPLGSSDIDVPLQRASISSIPVEGGSAQAVSEVGGLRLARKALSGATRQRLKKAKAEASVARTGGTQQPGRAPPSGLQRGQGWREILLQKRSEPQKGPGMTKDQGPIRKL
jgi:hypothetical protein